MNELKEKTTARGITLIALVVTIIVLLILAGVSIATLTGENGLLTKANQAKVANEQAGEKDLIQLAYQAAIMEEYQNTDSSKTLADFLRTELVANGLTGATVTDNGDGTYTVQLASGNSYIVDSNGNVTLAGPTVTHAISPETQIAEGEKITITITASTDDGTITKITKPDGSSVTNVSETTYEVEENGTYEFIVEGSNGGKTTHRVEITNGITVEKFSDIYDDTKPYIENGQTVAYIPKGFAVGTSSGINSVANGLVITDQIDPTTHKSTGNEFVWVPVEEPSDFITRDGYYNGSLQTLVSGGSTHEPSLTNYQYKDEAAEYSAMIASVTSKKGFYVARYEASKNAATQKAESKAGKTVWNYIVWGDSMTAIGTTGAVYQAQNMYTDTNTYGAKSTLIYGVQWDAIMKWMENEANPNVSGKTYIQNSRGKGYYGKSSPTTTGSNDSYAVKNIYDLAGNVCEWTMEAYNTNIRVVRGGNCFATGADYPASSRFGYRTPDTAYGDVGFRSALYVL